MVYNSNIIQLDEGSIYEELELGLNVVSVNKFQEVQRVQRTCQQGTRYADKESLVKLFEYKLEGSCAKVCLEYSAFQALDKFDRRRITEYNFNEIALQLLGALSYLHRANLVHKTLDLRQVMLTSVSFDQVRVRLLLVPQKFEVEQIDLSQQFSYSREELEGILDQLGAEEDRKMKNKILKDAFNFQLYDLQCLGIHLLSLQL